MLLGGMLALMTSRHGLHIRVSKGFLSREVFMDQSCPECRVIAVRVIDAHAIRMLHLL